MALPHFLGGAPRDLTFACPVFEGQASAVGYFDQGTIDAAYAAVDLLTVVAVLVAILACYLMTNTTLGPRFVRRWSIFWVVTGVVGALIPIGVLKSWDIRAAANACASNPAPFSQPLPGSEIWLRAMIGLGWGVVLFFLLSLILTRTAGRFVWARGLFHNRGCPWPRLVRLGE
jgi:hypothetical protein